MNATDVWCEIGITFASSGTVGVHPYGIYIDKNNTIYVPSYSTNQIIVWSEGSIMPTKTISGSWGSPHSVFVTNDGIFYIDDGRGNQYVKQWKSNETVGNSVLFSITGCFSLFVDIENNLYCSLTHHHQVTKKFLSNDTNIWSVVAGSECPGSTSNLLYYPRGIFVDINLNLYIADRVNNRIQKFLPNQTTGITVAGSGAYGTISLYYPYAVILDADEYLFIVDNGYNRVIGSGPYGFRCIIACSATAGSSSTQLSDPMLMSFDSYGNLYIVDTVNDRIQKFLRQRDNCSKLFLSLVHINLM